MGRVGRKHHRRYPARRLRFHRRYFFADGEVPRPMAEVPHPFVSESAHLFSFLPREEREKIYFIHLNHSIPRATPDFEGRKVLEAEGMHFATFGQEFEL